MLQSYIRRLFTSGGDRFRFVKYCRCGNDLVRSSLQISEGRHTTLYYKNPCYSRHTWLHTSGQSITKPGMWYQSDNVETMVLVLGSKSNLGVSFYAVLAHNTTTSHPPAPPLPRAQSSLARILHWRPLGILLV